MLHLCLVQVHICLLNTLRALLAFCSVLSHLLRYHRNFLLTFLLGVMVCSCVYCLLLNKWLLVLTQVFFVFWLLTFSSVPSLIWAEDSCLCDSTIHHVREMIQLLITLKLKKRAPVLSWLSSALLSCLVC